MIDFASDYISDIPWKEHPAFISDDNAENYINAFNAIFDKKPSKNQKISFFDDIWDFNNYYNNNESAYKFTFYDLSNQLKNYMKFWIIYKILHRKKLPTINKRYIDFKSVLISIFNTKKSNSIQLITNKDIINEIESRNIGPSTKHNLYEAIYQFFYFLVNNYKLDLLIDLNEIKRLGIEEKKKSKLADKLPDIPDEFFNKILLTTTKVMRNEDEEYNKRATACLLIILTQTGLRCKDLLELEVDNLYTKKLAKINKEVYYIHYKSRKPSKSEENILEFDIFSNELCTEAFKTLIEIRKQCIFSKENNFLYVLNHKINSKDIFPVAKYRFNIEHKRLLFNEIQEDCLREWEGISPCKYKEGHNKTAFFPDTRQYRVHLCTKLYEHNIPLVYIQKYMGHLSEEMMGYYVRPKDTYQENIAYSEKIINEIVGDDITPLGGSFGKELKENLINFIKKNNFNIKTDIHEIVKEFGDKVIIRGKTGGVCIKTSIVPCAKDNRTNQIYCAYNLCPNLFHFYYMVDVSYLDFKTLQETYTTMKENNHIRAAQKELNKLKDLCRKRLIPELDELDNELQRKGETFIVEKYPTLRDIIKNKEDIRKEVTLWMNKK